ncbi:MAG: type III secretion system chaperone [Pseudomonadota bacterium]
MKRSGMVEEVQIEAAIRKASSAHLTRDDVQGRLNEAARHLEIDSLCLDQNGVASMAIDDETELLLMHRPHLPGIVVAVPMPAEAAAHVGVLRQLLRANLSWTSTQGGSFGLVPGTQAPLLSRLILLNGIHAEELAKQITSFIVFAEGWLAKIELELTHQQDRQLGEVGGNVSPLQRI